jgi:heptaprenyl diphosphate synthase
MIKSKKLAILSLFLAAATGLYVIEMLYLPPLPFPGAKLGLANLIILLILFFYNWRDCLFNAIARTILGSLISGTLLTPAFIYSLAGALTSTLVMIIVFRLGKKYFSLVGVSVIGAFSHNLAQLVVATFVLAHWGVWLQLPYLIFLAIATGTFNGVLANLLVTRLVKVSLVGSDKALQKESLPFGIAE